MPITNALISDIFAETDYLTNSENLEKYSWYFVVAHTVNGGRFYSEPFYDYLSAENYFSDIRGLVEYFGGGQIEMLNINEKDYDVIAISRL